MVLWAGAGSFAAGKSKIGYVNVDSVFEQYEKTKSASDQMELERKQRLEQRREMVEEINRLKDASDLLSEEAKKEKQKVIDRKVKQLYQYEEEIQKKNLREGRTLLREVQDEIQEVLKLKGEKDGYDYIFIYTEDELGYRSNKYDITGEIVDMLNKRFGGDSAP
jgi:Skp family chaperone for outer membrane proteins